MSQLDVAHAIAAAARSMNQARSVEEALLAIAHAAQGSVPGFDQVGISTIDKGGKVETRAATGELVYELDELQYSLAEGPCVDTLREADVVVAPIALGKAREVGNLNDALESRGLIGQAIGNVMERYQMNHDRAFDFLVRASQHGNVKLRDVAQELVNTANKR